MNPDLASGRPAVPPIAKFRTVDENGRVVQSTAPLPAVISDVTKHYMCSVPSASMFRHDGKKLPFVDGVLSTNLYHDQAYLDQEIEEGNIYVREATDKEVEALAMKINPEGTMRTKITAEVERDTAQRLDLEIRTKLALQMNVPVEQIPSTLPPEPDPKQPELPVVDDAAKLGSTETLIEKAKRLAAERKAGTQARSEPGNAGGATITHPKGVETHGGGTLTPVGTQKDGNAVSSNGQTA